MIKLYGVPMSRAMRCYWMLEELGIPYESVKVSFVGGTRTPEFLKINPNGHIPVMQDGALTLWESLAINLYLARKHDRGLWPRSVEGEGLAFQWSLWAMTEAEEPLITALLHRAFLPEADRDPKKADDAVARFQGPLKVLDGALAGKDHLIENRFTVVDLNVASVLAIAPMLQLDLGSAPTAAAWLARTTGRPAYQKVSAPS